MATSATRLSATTTIDWIKTKGEIETYLYSRKARNIAIIRDDDHHRAVCRFELFGRIVQMEQRLLHEGDPKMKAPAANNQFTAGQSVQQRTQKKIGMEDNRRFRVLLMRVKLRLDLIFDEEDAAEREEMFCAEFMSDTLIPSGGTVREFMEPQITEAYKTGKMPSLLPGPGAYRLLEGE